jgi:tetratricopeptide (TPR) repeat protein
LDRFRQFVRLRDEAMFQGTLLTAVRLAPEDQTAADLRALRASAEEALSLAGVSPESGSLPAFDLALTADERADLAAGCQELLLVLAQEVALAPPGATPSQRREKAAEGIHILERARQLGLPGRAFHFRRAELLTQQGDEAGAAAERDRAKALPPASASDYYFGGVERYQQGDSHGAVQSFYEALRLQPNHFEAQCFLAICSLNEGRAREARVGFTACIGQRSGFAWSYLLRGVAEVQEQAFTDADTDFNTALSLDASPMVHYAALANRGRLEMRQGRWPEAAADLEAAVSVRPEECQAHLLLAQVFQGQKRFADADRELDTAARLHPELPLVHRRHGELLLERREFDAALRHFEKAIRLEPADSRSPSLVSVYVACGGIRHAQGRFADAVAAYDAALRVRPDHALAHHLRGEALLKLNRVEDAERAFGQSLKHKPGYGPALRARGEARVRLGDFAGAIEDYTRALQGERDAGLLEHRGWALFFADAWKLAERDFDEAVRLSQHPGDAQVGRGLARAMLGDYRRAVADAEAVLQGRAPRTPEMMHNVACVFALASARAGADAAEPRRQTLEDGYRRQAVAALRKALELVSPAQRLAFWQEKMRPDPALEPIRKSAEFVQLDAQLQKGTAYGARSEKKGR